MRSWVPMMAAVLTTVGLGQFESKAWGCEYTEIVHGWYHDYLHRHPEPAALHFWVRQLRCGTPAIVVQANFLGGDEYYHAHGCTPEAFVASLYEDVLSRPASHCDLNAWVCKLRHCGCRKRLALDFLTAAQAELGQRAALAAHAAYQPVVPVVPAAPAYPVPVVPAAPAYPVPSIPAAPTTPAYPAPAVSQPTVYRVPMMVANPRPVAVVPVAPHHAPGLRLQVRYTSR